VSAVLWSWSALPPRWLLCRVNAHAHRRALRETPYTYRRRGTCRRVVYFVYFVRIYGIEWKMQCEGYQSHVRVLTRLRETSTH
jgi:hypothetical protein